MRSVGTAQEGKKKVDGGCGCNLLVRPSLRRVLPGNRLKPVPLRRERAAAAAIPRGIGILKDESLAYQCLFVFERRAVQIQKTLRVHENARAVLFENFVAVPRLCIEAHGIRQSGAAAA